MTENEKAAFVQAQAAAALIEAIGMLAANSDPKNTSLAYYESDFLGLLDKYGLHHNNLISYFLGY